MTTIDIIFLLVVACMLQFICVWAPCANKLDQLTDDLVHISSNRDINWVFTHILIPYALIYEMLHRKINNKGMAILFVTLTLATLPCSPLCTVIGLDILAVKSIWQWFCETFKREPAFKEQTTVSVKTDLLKKNRERVEQYGRRKSHFCSENTR